MRTRKQGIRPAGRTRPDGKTTHLLADRVVWRSVASLTPFPNNPRIHPRAQICRLMRSIANGWTNPILIDESGTILAGHGRLEAAKQLGFEQVPTLMLSGRSPAEKIAIVVNDNKLPEQSVFDFDLLKVHFKTLLEIDFDVEETGFTTGEVDILLETPTAEHKDVVDDIDIFPEGPPVSEPGDLWILGEHRIFCGNSLQEVSFDRVLGGDRAQLVVTDPPYNVRVNGHVRGPTARQFREFAMASGEMSEREFQGFLSQSVGRAIAASTAGSIHYWFIDWRHLPELLAAARPQYTEWKNLLVWRKTNSGLGAFYRSQHELIGVFKAGRAAHINNFGMGEKGRHRTNVLEYAGATSFGKNRDETFDSHPTVKPCALIADLIRDCSHRNGIVFDLFGGSGTTILAAQRTGRRARLIEIDPAYVDLTIRRWEKMSGLEARHAVSGRTFQETEKSLSAPPPPSSKRGPRK